jgi:subtilisin family serine protease
MDWALANGCHVISMSLGADVDEVSQVYETIGQRALDQGCLIVAAAGNNARRNVGKFGFVTPPANSRSIMSVGAVDRFLQIANFSARSSTLTGLGGKVDIVAPGVAVFSSVPGGHDGTFNGTSMATPHVAGIAAMLAEKTGQRGAALWTAVTQLAQALPIPQVDVGSGLAQAPQ